MNKLTAGEIHEKYGNVVVYFYSACTESFTFRTELDNGNVVYALFSTYGREVFANTGYSVSEIINNNSTCYIEIKDGVSHEVLETYGEDVF